IPCRLRCEPCAPQRIETVRSGLQNSFVLSEAVLGTVLKQQHLGEQFAGRNYSARSDRVFIHTLFKFGCRTHARECILRLSRCLCDPGGYFTALNLDLLGPVITLGLRGVTQSREAVFGGGGTG